jgi:hypothetical protein
MNCYKLKLHPMVTFCNLYEKELRKMNVITFAYLMHYVNALCGFTLYFQLTETGFVTSEKDYRKLQQKTLNVIQYN